MNNTKPYADTLYFGNHAYNGKELEAEFVEAVTKAFPQVKLNNVSTTANGCRQEVYLPVPDQHTFISWLIANEYAECSLAIRLLTLTTDCSEDPILDLFLQMGKQLTNIETINPATFQACKQLKVIVTSVNETTISVFAPCENICFEVNKTDTSARKTPTVEVYDLLMVEWQADDLEEGVMNVSWYFCETQELVNAEEDVWAGLEDFEVDPPR